MSGFKLEKSESIGALAAALCKAQGEFSAVPMDATNRFLGNKYADLGSVIETAKPILVRHELSVSQTVIGDAGSVGISTILLHSSGEWICSSVCLPVGDEKGKSMAQVAGSIVTYLRRYAYASILGLYTEEEDDGNEAQSKAGGQQRQQQQQRQPSQPAAAPSGATRPAPTPAQPQQPAPAQPAPPAGPTDQQAAAELEEWGRQWVAKMMSASPRELKGKARTDEVNRMKAHLVGGGVPEIKLGALCKLLHETATAEKLPENTPVSSVLDARLILALGAADTGSLFMLGRIAKSL